MSFVLVIRPNFYDLGKVWNGKKFVPCSNKPVYFKDRKEVHAQKMKFEKELKGLKVLYSDVCEIPAKERKRLKRWWQYRVGYGFSYIDSFIPPYQHFTSKEKAIYAAKKQFEEVFYDSQRRLIEGLKIKAYALKILEEDYFSNKKSFKKHFKELKQTTTREKTQ